MISEWRDKGSLAWLDKSFCTSRKKEMTGFIIGGTILGNYLCSLIRKCILPGPRKNEMLLCALWISLEAKQRSRRDGVQQTCRQAVRNTEQSNLTGHFPVPVLCPQLWKNPPWEWERDAQRLCETAKENEGREGGLYNETDIQWISTERKSSDSVIPSSKRVIFCL